MSKVIKELNDINKALWKERFDLIARVIELINIVGWNEEGKYTFKDGETWERFDPDYDINQAKETYKHEQ